MHPPVVPGARPPPDWHREPFRLFFPLAVLIGWIGVWTSVWLMPIGLVGAGVFPDLRIAALHVLFIGGFSLMGFGVATHVSLSHLNLEALALGRPAAVWVLGGTVLLAMLARVGADLSSAYFDHLGWAAALWLVGSGVWLAFLGPKLARR